MFVFKMPVFKAGFGKLSSLGRTGVRALAVAAVVATTPMMAATAVHAHEISVTIERVRGIGKADLWSRSDFYAEVTINGQMTKTEIERNKNDAKPNWVIRRTVDPGIHDVKIAIFEKDLTKVELIDINRVGGKKDLDFQVDSKPNPKCRLIGFADPYRCGDQVIRQGDEGKSAELSFTVGVIQ